MRSYVEKSELKSTTPRRFHGIGLSPGKPGNRRAVVELFNADS